MIRHILTAALIMTAADTFAQNVSINADGSNPDNSAILDLKSDSKGLLVPRMQATDIANISNPARGLLVYQTDGSSGFYYNASTPATPNWTLLGATGPQGPQGNQGIQGVAGPQGASGIVATSSFNGVVGAIAVNPAAYVFVGPTATVTITTGQRLTVNAVASLGLPHGSSEQRAELGVCYKNSSGGTVNNLAGMNYVVHRFIAGPLTYSAMGSLTPGAGTYSVGMCIKNFGPAIISDNNYVNGYVQITN